MFGERLKELRMASGLSQSALASKLFISQQAVAGWELNKGSPNPETLVKISDILNVSVDHLVGRNTDEEKPTPVTEDGPREEAHRLVDQIPPARLAEAMLYIKFIAETSDQE